MAGVGAGRVEELGPGASYSMSYLICKCGLSASWGIMRIKCGISGHSLGHGKDHSHV